MDGLLQKFINYSYSRCAQLFLPLIVFIVIMILLYSYHITFKEVYLANVLNCLCLRAFLGYQKIYRKAVRKLFSCQNIVA